MTTPQRIDMPEPTIAAKGKGTGGMDYTIIGTTMQAVICEIDQGESIVSQSGGMAWMSGNIAMNTNMSGGLGGLLRRVVSGESLFVAEYSCTNGRGFVSFASDFPGKIVPITLAAGQEVIAQKQAFLCAEKSVQDFLVAKASLWNDSRGQGWLLSPLTVKSLNILSNQAKFSKSIPGMSQ